MTDQYDRTTSSSSSVNKLNLPRHSYNASLASNSSIPGPHFLTNTSKSFNSALRLSRVNTSNTDNVITDAQSVRASDRLPSAKPNVTHSDKLWTQIDVLDDVRNMSSQVRLKGSFFNDDLNSALNTLKQSQNRLLDTIASQSFNSLSDKEHRKQVSQFGGEGFGGKRESVDELGDAKDRAATIGSLRATSPPSNTPSRPISYHPAEEPEKKKQDRIDGFFDNDDLSKFSVDILYRKQNFEEMNQYVDEIRSGLEVVSESMKKFDETTRELW